MKSGIYIVATPIGNLNDISLRAKEVLNEADIVACEDTRVTKKLFSLLGLNRKKTFIAFHDHNEEERAQTLIEYVNQGLSVAQVSDAGSPLISDPGFHLIKQCRLQGIGVYAIPGPCALICALQLSGLPTNRFMFAGFIPNKDKARNDLFNKLKDIDATLVFYETANRLLKTLYAAENVFKNREFAVAREMTKIYEECRNGTARELIAHFEADEPKGEIVLMVAPPDESGKPQIDVEALLRREMQRQSLKGAVKALVDEYGLNKNDVYDLALKIKNE